MKRRKLQLPPTKEKNTLHSYFTTKSCNADAVQDGSEACSSKEVAKCDLPPVGPPDVEEHDKETPTEPSAKKVKLSDSSNGSEDLIPATPEEKPLQPKNHAKSKSRRSISFAPSRVLLQSKTTCNSVNDPTTVKSERQSSTLDEKKEIKPTHKTPQGLKNVSRLVAQSTVKSGGYVSKNDPVLEELLSEVVLSEKKDVVLSSSRQQNGKLSSLAKIHAIKPSNNAEDDKKDDAFLAKILAEVEQKPAEKIVSSESEERNANAKPTTSKVIQKDKSNKAENKTNINKNDSDVTILKDSTATKCSPNRGDFQSDDFPQKKEKCRNIFLDPIEGEDNYLLQKLGFKQGGLVEQKNSKCKDSKVQKEKLQITPLRTARPSRHSSSPATSSSDEQKSALESVAMYPSLMIFKEKLLKRKNGRLSLPSDSSPKCAVMPDSLPDKSSNKRSSKPAEVENAQNDNQEKVSCPPVLSVSESTTTSLNPSVSSASSERPTPGLAAKHEIIKKIDVASITAPKNLAEIKGTLPEKGDSGVEKVPESPPAKNETTAVRNDVPSQKISEVVGTKDVNDDHNPAEKLEIQKEANTDFLFEDCLDAHDIDGFQDDWGMTQFTAKENDNPTSYPETLELGTARHCKVISVSVVKPNWEFLIWVECGETKKTASCTVRGSWALLALHCGDMVCLDAVLANNENCSTRWIIDNTRGKLVLHPDTLISGTAVVGSLFCTRRSVLSDSFKGVDYGSPVMAIGSLIHEIMQEVLQENLRSLVDIRGKADAMVADPRNVRRFYEAGLSLNQVRSELQVYLPTIATFVSKYVDIKQPKKNGNSLCVPPKACDKPKSFTNSSEEWAGRIVSIEDIEENLWDPVLGVKGKVDVTVKVKESDGKTKVLPLEMKTGRTSHSAEHRGQVMLYSMMLSRLGAPVESGLLLYLREGSIREVKSTHLERRDLLIMRNKLAHHLEIAAKVDECDIEDIATLPEPINFASACAKCPFLTVCSAHLRKDTKVRLEENHPMNQLSIESTKHLTNDHLNYFFKETQMLRIESQQDSTVDRTRNVWSMAPEKREKMGQSLANLQIDGDVQHNAGKFVHTFIRNGNVGLVASQPLSDDFRRSKLNTGDYVVISTNKRVAVDTGNILDIEPDSISVAFNRDLRKRNTSNVYHIDAYESSAMMLKFNLSNLACLMDDTESANRLRQAVIDKAPPSFSRVVKRDVLKDLVHLLAKLNRSQRDAILSVLKSDHYTLIKGLPGTGKTATMVALVCLLVKLGQSVLITSHTHSAVDNLLLRLKGEGINFLRVGSAKRIHPGLLEHSEGHVTRDCKTPEDLARTFDTFQVVAVVCLGMTHALFSRGRVFDICLVDESTQVLQSTILRPLLSAHRFVLVGDPDQLPPVVKSKRARSLGLAVSLFALLDQGEATKSLCSNYRMNKCITDLANKLTYDNKLKCGSEEVANASLQPPNLKDVIEDPVTKPWLKTVLSPALESSVLFLDSCGAHLDPPSSFADCASEFRDKIETHVTNFYEVVVLQKILECLVKAGVDQNEVGIIAPYRAQVALIRAALKISGEYAKVEVNSVDQYQGRDKQVIMYSCTRSDESAGKKKNKAHEILNDHRRLTVAVTRAKCKLILIGDFATLQNYSPFEKLFSCLSSEQKINLPPELQTA